MRYEPEQIVFRYMQSIILSGKSSNFMPSGSLHLEPILVLRIKESPVAPGFPVVWVLAASLPAAGLAQTTAATTCCANGGICCSPDDSSLFSLRREGSPIRREAESSGSQRSW